MHSTELFVKTKFMMCREQKNSVKGGCVCAIVYVWVVLSVGIYIAQYTVIIREYGSTLYVGLARAVSPTNKNFRLTFLLTQLQEFLYEDLGV